MEGLKILPDNSIDCVITSPPYWSLRDYGVGGQLGLEPTFQEYIQKLCNIFDEVKRILKKEGTCWVNIGDTYSTVSGSMGKNKWSQPIYSIADGSMPKKIKTPLPDKSLCQIPSRFAIEMTNRGWILRNEIIWHKPNCMPSSAKDRFTVDFEKIFFFVKNKKYWFNQQFEPYTEPMNRWGGEKLVASGESSWDNGTGQTTYRDRDMRPNPEGRNKRTVWSVNTKPYKGAHFATFPEDLVVPMIKAGCPEFVCKKCGKAREKVIEKDGEFQRRWSKNNVEGSPYIKQSSMQNIYKVIGLTDCGCNAGFGGGVVLDPFFGSGTTGVVAIRNRRNYIGIELNPEYIKLANDRIQSIEQNLF